MANICTNMCYCSTENQANLEQIEKYMQDTFEVWNIDGDDDFIEIEFGSRWSFPADEMETLTQRLQADNTLYIRCLSYEFGCDYVDYMIFENSEWHSQVN